MNGRRSEWIFEIECVTVLILKSDLKKSDVLVVAYEKCEDKRIMLW